MRRPLVTSSDSPIWSVLAVEDSVDDSRLEDEARKQQKVNEDERKATIERQLDEKKRQKAEQEAKDAAEDAKEEERLKRERRQVS